MSEDPRKADARDAPDPPATTDEPAATDEPAPSTDTSEGDARTRDGHASVPDGAVMPVVTPAVTHAATPVPEERPRVAVLLRRWAFALVPAVGVLELLLHAKQVAGVVPESDWDAARVAVAKIATPADLVLFAPLWTDPIGREHFGDALSDVTRTARGDESSYARAIEVSIRGKHRPELEGWKSVAHEKVGAITITTLENPRPVHVIDDLLAHAADGERPRMSVQRVDGGRESECAWTQTGTQAGGLGAGPAVPGNRFACSGGNFVGISIIHALDHSPRRCFLAPSGGGPSVLRVRFADVTFGDALHGHAALPNQEERDKTGAPVTLTWKVGDRVLGKLVHHDGEGWKGFELSTTDLRGQKADLVAEVTSSSARRQLCFQADTR